MTKINNANCNDVMSLKEAKKIIDSCKDKLHITVARDCAGIPTPFHQAQSSVSTTGAVNNFYKGIHLLGIPIRLSLTPTVTGNDFLTSSSQSYSNQNLYVQPPTRNPNLHQNGSFDEKADPMLGKAFRNSLGARKVI